MRYPRCVSSIEKPTLSQRADLSSHSLTIRQSRFMLWGILLFVLNGLFGFLGGLLSSWALLFLVLGLPMMGFLLAADWLLPGQAQLHLSSSQLTIRAWTGQLPRPRRWSIPLAGLHVDSFMTGHVCSWSTHQLSLHPADGPTLRLDGLIGTTDELRTITATIQAATAHASARQGEGQAEVPAALRAMADQPHRT